MKNLISMTDFILNQELPTYLQKEEFEEAYYKLHNYANFIKQTLKLWMFVPCDKEGNVLEEPKFVSPDGVKWGDYAKEYQKAKERCLFEGFTSCITNRVQSVSHEKCTVHFELIDGENIESISNRKIQLTQTAIKQLGL